MPKIIYDEAIMKYINIVESLTNAKVKDCINNEKVIFIIEQNDIGKAIGKRGINIRKIEGILNKKVRMIEFNDNILQFIRNLTYPHQIDNVTQENGKENGIVFIKGNNVNARSLLIGRDRKNINELKDIVRRFFKIEDIKVV